jgi:glycosyltransferase involved in cell wall biosynthesis
MNYFIASHISDLYGPTEELIKYLIIRKIDFRAVLNPLEYCVKARRHIVFFKSNRINRKYLYNLHKPAILSWILDFIFITFFMIIGFQKIDEFIGCDPLNAIAGIIGKKIGKVSRVIYYTIDWSEYRFQNMLLNQIYYRLDNYCIRQADENWCVSKRLINLRKKQNVDFAKLKFVPIGIYAKKPLIAKKYNHMSLVYLGALEKTKGIELVIKAWPLIKKRLPNISLYVIGKTPSSIAVKYEEILSKLNDVYVLGLKDHDEVLKLLPSYGIGLAPYSSDVTSVTKYADPSRIKDYISCGLPVITTNVPEISEDIDQIKAGKIVNYTIRSFVEGIVDLINSDHFFEYKLNAYKLALKYNWREIFSQVIE